MKNWQCIPLVISFTLVTPVLWAQAVIEDRGVGMERDELEQVIDRWPGEMKRAAANDLGDRLELLNIAMANKKMAMEADKLTPDSDPVAEYEPQCLPRLAIPRQQTAVERSGNIRGKARPTLPDQITQPVPAAEKEFIRGVPGQDHPATVMGRP